MPRSAAAIRASVAAAIAGAAAAARSPQSVTMSAGDVRVGALVIGPVCRPGAHDFPTAVAGSSRHRPALRIPLCLRRR